VSATDNNFKQMGIRALTFTAEDILLIQHNLVESSAVYGLKGDCFPKRLWFEPFLTPVGAE
jgi:hypothetical protein